MCGINGIFAYHHAASTLDSRELLQTRDHMEARGPDGKGSWIADDSRVGFGHRRLSIVDLTDAGSQPMFSEDRKLALTFNGEIYNYAELRRRLEAQGIPFRTNCDTEILLHLYSIAGRDMVHQLRGMFAFAIWDANKRGLLIARDAYGIKPLYTANDGWTFRFASQVKALLAGGKVSRDPEPAGIVGFHLWGSVPEPFTLYREIRSLPAGTTQWIDCAGPRPPKQFVSIPGILAAGESSKLTSPEIRHILQDGVRESLRAHLMADVEVGVFLSAGVDSGALLGLMRDTGQKKLKAVTIAFEEFKGTSEDESPLASELARRYGAEHVVRRVTPQEFRADLPLFLHAMDQPSIDGVNTWFASKAAREVGLKVVLSGLGGDELLAGYPSFRQIPLWVKRLRLFAAVPGMGILSRNFGIALGLGGTAPKRLGLLEFGGSYPGAYLLRRGLFLPFELKTQLDPHLLLTGLKRLRTLDRLAETGLTPPPRSGIAKVAALESVLYMRNQLLRDSDWAGMAHSIEIRTPLVDLELLKTLAPIIPKLGTGIGKQIIAEAPSIPLPASVIDRPKTGFGVPTSSWMDLGLTNGNTATKGHASRAWAELVGKQMYSDRSLKFFGVKTGHEPFRA